MLHCRVARPSSPQAPLSIQPHINTQRARNADRLLDIDDRALKLLDTNARPIDIRAAQIGAGQLGIGHFRAAQIALVEDHTRQISTLKVRVAQVATLEAHPLEYRTPELGMSSVAAFDQHILGTAISRL